LIFSFLHRARRRFLWNEVIAQFAFAAALLMAGVVLLLLLGTQILDWRVILVVCIAGFGVALYRTLKRIPGNYKMAVMLDQRTGLYDAISTAYFFTDPAKAEKVSGSVRSAQLASAEALIPSVNLETAIPFRFPRAFYAMGILGVVASSLFALRYGSQKQLDWKPPISQLLIETLGLKDPEAKQLAKKKQNDLKPAELLDDAGNPLPRSEQKKAGELDKAPAAALDSVGEPNVNNEKAEGASAKGGDGKSEGSDKNGSEAGDSEKADAGTPQAGKNGTDNPAGKDGPQQGEQSAGQKNSGDNSSLLSKMKDAMSNLLSKAKPQQNNADGQKQSAGQQNSQKAQNQQKSGEKGSQSQNQQGDSQESADGQQGEQPGESDNSQDSQGKGSGKSSEQQAAAQPGSGVGKQDGAKDVKAAEQKAAMGKLSEIIGKRSANVSGEMMLDVQSGPQQLRTAYSQSKASHNASGGDVSRDEVPVALQGYVQQYFEEVRKAERAVGSAPAKAKPAGTKPAGPDSKPSSLEK
jgi:hypothetical protein